MMDRWVIARLRPGLEAGARGLVRLGIGADAVTWAGFVIGMVAAACISQQAFAVGLVLLLVSRLLDGLDGAVARLTQPTDRGAFLDITLDFLFYASILLAFAVLAERRGLRSTAYPAKGLYYLGGLTEATETLLVFAAMCLWPQAFPLLALAFAGLCGLTVLTRLWFGWRVLSGGDARMP